MGHPISHGTVEAGTPCTWPDCYEPADHADIPLCELQYPYVEVES